MKLIYLGVVLMISLMVLSVGAVAMTDYHSYNLPAEDDDRYEERTIEVPTYSGQKVYKIVRSVKWMPTTTQRYGTYGPDVESVEPVLGRTMETFKRQKIPTRLKAQTEKPGAITFTGKRTGTITQINYNGKYDYGFIKKDNSAFKFAFTAKHDEFKRWDHVKFDLKRVSASQTEAINLAKIE
ncbi:hypothetical protein KY335_05495 [Candidatus Woesearchaeota archaeon]|nr:hypothetical protein [Candidatus Woesearchaeota archaeon]